MITKSRMDLDDFYFANTLDETAITALPGKINEKKSDKTEKKSKSNLYLCIGDEARRIFKARKPAVSIKTERYQRCGIKCFNRKV